MENIPILKNRNSAQNSEQGKIQSEKYSPVNQRKGILSRNDTEVKPRKLFTPNTISRQTDTQNLSKPKKLTRNTSTSIRPENYPEPKMNFEPLQLRLRPRNISKAEIKKMSDKAMKLLLDSHLKIIQVRHELTKEKLRKLKTTGPSIEGN
jgi:hypothetical protein